MKGAGGGSLGARNPDEEAEVIEKGEAGRESACSEGAGGGLTGLALACNALIWAVRFWIICAICCICAAGSLGAAGPLSDIEGEETEDGETDWDECTDVLDGSDGLRTSVRHLFYCQDLTVCAASRISKLVNQEKGENL